MERSLVLRQILNRELVIARSEATKQSQLFGERKGLRLLRFARNDILVIFVMTDH